MNEFAVLAAVATLVILVVLAEIAAAALPLIIVITLVPPHERPELAAVLAACDSSRKLRLWAALQAAVKARRLRRRRDRAGRQPAERAPSRQLFTLLRVKDRHVPK